jgi:nitroreductase
LDVATVIQKRRSIRKYKNKEIPMELLTQILEVARLAPSGANRQPWHLVVVTDAEKRKALIPICKDQKFVGECSAFIAGIDDPTQKWARVDIAIAMEHIALMAADKGLGTCWVGAFDQEKLKAALGVPPGMVVTVGMTLGYPDEAPEARTRKAMNELVYWESYS